MSPAERAALAAVALAVATGCGENHARLGRLRAQAPSAAFADGCAMREPPEGTVARGHLDADAHRFTGRAGGAPARALPMLLTAAVMQRGRERYEVFCAPCHRLDGSGDGVIVRHGFPRPADLASPRARSRTVGDTFDAITRGFGRMFPMAAQVPVDDRWAIAAYVAALRVAASARAEDVPPVLRARSSR